MKVVYTGKTKEFTPQLEKKVEAKLSRLGKMIERRGEREAHLFHQEERHLHKVEVKMNFYDHQLSAACADGDLLTAVTEAVEKLDKQIVRLRTKWRDTRRDPNGTRATKEALVAKADNAAEAPRVTGQPGRLDGKANQLATGKAIAAQAKTGAVVAQEKALSEKSRTGVTKAAAVKKAPKVYKVNHSKGQKPMSLEEAILSLDDGEDYVVYRDVDKDAVAVLVRRRDGHLDLIES